MSHQDDPRRIETLLAIMARLRDPKTGCPWDVEQTFATIAPYTVEEAYEVADAIERKDMAQLNQDHDPPASPAEQARRAHLWLLRQDLSAYVLLGDPAARLALTPRAQPSWRLADDPPDPTLHVQMSGAPDLDPDALARLESQIVRHLAGAPLADVAADAGISRDDLQAAVDAYRTAARAALARHVAGR